jgi:hypothetical protein
MPTSDFYIMILTLNDYFPQSGKAFYSVSERKLGIFSKIKEGNNYNHPSTISQTYGAGRNTLSISRIYPPRAVYNLSLTSRY